MKKNILVACSLLLILCICLLCTCGLDHPPPHKVHYIDTNATREAQVAQCASCHKQEYENWKIGPHANAYLTLVGHARLVDSSENFPEGYNAYVESVTANVCLACHTGQNIFETNFSGIDHVTFAAMLKSKSLPHAFDQALSRDLKNKAALFTGVDCMTCHVQNGQVVTNLRSKAGDSSGVIRSAFFSDNMSCYSCHHHQVSTMKELVEKKELPAEISCVGCHQEYDAQKKGTHYDYWRNDPPSKKRPSHLNIFECVKLDVEVKGAAHELAFNWTNTVMPHGYSECGDAKCVVLAVYKNKKEKIVLEQNLNRKDFFDRLKEFPKHFHTGKNGNNFSYNTPILLRADIENFAQLDHFVIRGFVKPQYWSSDKEFALTFEKKVTIEPSL